MAVTLTHFVRGNNLKPADFNFNDADNLIEVKTNVGSAVGDAIAAAAAPDASETVKGIVELATPAETTTGTSNTLATTPAGVAAAIAAAVAALPADKFLEGLKSYDAATNTLTLELNDGTEVPVDMTDLIADAVASVTATPDASETVKGIVELATEAEALAGGNNNVITSTTLQAALAAAIAAQVDVFGL